MDRNGSTDVTSFNPITALSVHQSLPVETTTLGDVLALFKEGRSHMVLLTSQLPTSPVSDTAKTIKRGSSGLHGGQKKGAVVGIITVRLSVFLTERREPAHRMRTTFLLLLLLLPHHTHAHPYTHSSTHPIQIQQLIDVLQKILGTTILDEKDKVRGDAVCVFD